MAKKLINGLLLLGIAGLLLAYFYAVNELPERIYTPAQQEYLDYNNNRSIAQSAPALNFLSPNGTVDEVSNVLMAIPGGESRVRANLKARYEEQQGVTITVYDLEFQGEYILVGPASSAIEVELVFRFPGDLETLHDVRFAVDGVEPSDAVYTTRAISWRTTLLGGDTHRIDVSYQADGANTFAYSLPSDQRSDIDVVVTVAGLSGSSIPRTSLPATENTSADGSETFSWNYTGLIANRDIQISLPARLSFAQRIAELQDDFRTLGKLAPILVGLFVACLVGLFSLNGLRVRLEEYLLAGLGLALFYPLLTFTSGMIGIVSAAIVALVVVSGLLFGFLGLIAGWAKAWRPLSVLLMVFVGFFSLGMLTPWRGLLLTSGGLLLLVTFMWFYARRYARSSLPSVSETGNGMVDIQPAAEKSMGLPENTLNSYCVHCGQALEDTYTFCPGCGHDSRTVQRCSHCEHQLYIPPDMELAYCIYCGNQLAEA